MADKPLTMLDNAIKYAEYGWKVYPLIQSGKIPHKGSNGHLDASNDPEEVKRLFLQYGPSSNIGISLLDTEYIIIDIDLHQEGKSGFESLQELEDAYQELPDTFTVTTPRNGEHKYFKVSGLSLDRDVIDFRPGVDVLGSKVMAVPSQTEKGAYRVKSGKISDIAELPRWFLEVMAQHDRQKQRSNESFTVTYPTRYGNGKGRTIQLLEEIIQGVGEGERNAFFTRAFGTLLKANMDIEAAIKLMLDWNAHYVQPPLGKNELHSVLKSIVSRENKKERM